MNNELRKLIIQTVQALVEQEANFRLLKKHGFQVSPELWTAAIPTQRLVSHLLGDKPGTDSITTLDWWLYSRHSEVFTEAGKELAKLQTAESIVDHLLANSNETP